MIRIGASFPATARIGIPHPHQKKKQRLRASSSDPNLRSTAAAATKRISLASPPMDSKGASIASSSPKSPSSPPPRQLILAPGMSARVTMQFCVGALRSLLLLFNGFLLLLLLPFRGGTKSEASEKSPTAIVVRRALKESEAAARRAMAIRRLREIEEIEEEEQKSSREFWMMTSERGETLFTRSWTPTAVQTRGLIIVMHGLNEHSGRYNHFAKQLNASGFKVYAMDWIGHGGSDGLHGYVHSLDYAVSDLKAFLDKVLADNPGLPCFFFGHSTGAAIILKAALDPKVETRINGVAVTSPAVRVQPSHPLVAVVAPLVSILLPRYQFSRANKKGLPVSRDPEALRVKYSDPLVFTGSIRVRTGYEVLRISYYLQENLNRITFPFLVLHGTADTVTDPTASQRLYYEASSTDKSIKLYDGYFHDLLFEPERDDIAEDIITWFRSRLDAQ